MRNTYLILAIVALFSIGGCSVLMQPVDTIEAIKKCEYDIVNTRPEIKLQGPKLTLKGLQPPTVNIVVNVDISMKNTTNKELRLSRMALNLYVDDKEMAKLDTSAKVTVKPGTTETIPAKFVIDAIYASEKIAKKMEKKDVTYQVMATFYFDIGGIDLGVGVATPKRKG